MLERFLLLDKHCSQVLITLNLNNTHVPNMVNGSELNCLRKICSLLRPFEQLTRELSTEKCVMSSKVIPLILCTKNEIQKQEDNNTIAKCLKIKLLEELDYRCGSLEQTPILPICTILDPRFKDMHFQNPLSNSKTQEKIVSMIDRENRDTINISLEPEEIAEDTNINYDLWGLHKSLEKKHNDKRSSNTTSRGELNAYLQRNVIKLNEDPLQEWQNTKTIYPRLYKLAMKYLVIPGTSVPSERLFSKAGATINQTRNRLLGSNLSKLLFLQSIDKNQWNL